jgi:mRNA-degrading endonuclease toxin of MazEF toxin-antitoxin module
LLIVSDDVLNRNQRYPKAMAVHLTSVHRAGGPYAWEAELPKGTGNLPHSSVAKCAEVFTLAKDQLESLIGAIPRLQMQRIDRALAIALSLPFPRSDDEL